MRIFDSACPRCGTAGKLWHRKPEVFRCTSCSSLFSRFGFVVEAEQEHEHNESIVWS